MSRVTLLALLVALTLLAAGCSRAGSPGDPFANIPATVDDGIAPLSNSTDATATQVDPALMAQLRAELVRVLSVRGITLDADGNPIGKAVSALPKRTYAYPDRIDFPPSETAELGWIYSQPGDYDLNGEVNVSDLTPVGVYFNAKSGDANWSEAQVADGDGNGEVNVSDITPIGVNFGIQTYGYVVESRDSPAADWQEFGFVPLSSGSKVQWYVNMHYVAAGGSFLNNFRVAPVGPPRDFDWTRYALTDDGQDYWTAELCVLDGKPAAAFTAYRDAYGSRLHFALSQSAHPASPADWTIESAVALNYDGFDPPALAVVGGEPVIAYFVDASPAEDLRYLRRDGSGIWGSHIVTTFVAYSPGLDLFVRQDKPVIYANDMGLLMISANVQVPGGNSDWTFTPANPLLSGFQCIDGLASGPWLFACGINGGSGENLAYNRSNAADPLTALSFTEFTFATGGATDTFPSLALNGGVPAVAWMDSLGAALMYGAAASRKDDNSAGWQLHGIAGGDNKLNVTEKPRLSLIDGRPAILAGFDPLTLYWSNAADPAQAGDWHAQPISTEIGHITHSLVTIEGLPVIAYETLDEINSVKQVSIGVAQEK